MTEIALRRLVQGAALYVVGDLGARAIDFLLVPVLAHYLLPAEYGVLQVLRTVTSVLVIVTALGLTGSMTRQYFDYPDAAPRETYLGTAATTMFFVTLGAALVANLAGETLWRQFLPDVAFVYFRIASWTMVANVAPVVLLTICRVRREAGQYVALQFAQALLTAGCVLYFVVWRRDGALGKLWGECLAAAAIALPLVVMTVRRVPPRFSPAMAQKALTFGLPLVPHLLFWWVIDLSDRLILRHYRGLDEVGIYGFGYTLSMVMIVGVSGFNSAWAPWFFSLRDGAHMKAAAALSLGYLSVLLMGGLMLSLFAEEIVQLIASPAYRDASRVVPLVTTAYVFTGASTLFLNQIMLAGRSYLIPLVTVVAMSVNVALNVALIPRFGMLGAASATLVAMAAYAGVTFIVGQRVCPVPYAFARLLGVFTLYAVFLTGGVTLNASAIVKVAIALVFAMCASGLGGVARLRDVDVAPVVGTES